MMKLLSLLFVLCCSCVSFSSVSSASESTTKLLILGDSLSAGYQMSLEQSWPSLLPAKLSEKGIDVQVINASISGDTTGNGLDRLENLLSQHTPDWVLIELGANDGLRGFPPATIKNNLTDIITRSRNNGADVILMQIEVLPNYGKRYTQSFSDIYPQLSKELNAPLIPFFLEQVIIKPEWMMKDGIHPNAEAQPWVAEFMAEELMSLVGS